MKREMSWHRLVVIALILTSGSLAFGGGRLRPARFAAPAAAQVCQISSPAPGGGQASSPSTDSGSGAVFRSTPDLSGAVQISHNISPDKKAATINFRNLQVSIPEVPPLPAGTPPHVGAARLDGTQNVETRTATVSLPITAKSRETKLRQIVRGHVDVSDLAQAVLVIRAAGKTTVVDLKASTKDKDFESTIEGVLPADAVYQATFMLLVERIPGNPARGGLFSVDSFDVELTGP